MFCSYYSSYPAREHSVRFTNTVSQASTSKHTLISWARERGAEGSPTYSEKLNTYSSSTIKTEQ